MTRLVGAIAVFFLSLSATAMAGELSPGDRGFKHQELHSHYQELFKAGKCVCATGECRPTEVRSSSRSPTGYLIKVNGGWFPVPKGALIYMDALPAQLRRYQGHVCAYETDGDVESIRIECAVVHAEA